MDGLGNISTNEYSRAEPHGNKVELQKELWVHCQGLTTTVRLSEGRGQNNQQPTPNDNNKRVVVFLCGSGIWSPQGDVLQAFR